MTVSSLEVTPLPKSGVLVIGRSAAADVRLSDRTAAARHLRLEIGPRITVEDLGSAGGTRLAGQPLAPHTPTEILPGEPVALGATVLMVRESRAEERPQRIWAHDSFIERVDDECGRGGAFCLVRLRLEPAAAPAPASLERALAALALFAPVPHAVGAYGDHEYELLWVGLPADVVDERLTSLRDLLVGAGFQLRAGHARFPDDGRAADMLLDRANTRLLGLEGTRPCFSPTEAALVAAAAEHTRPLVLVGERGAGKETLARAIHAASARAGGPFCVFEVAGAGAALERTLLGPADTGPGAFLRAAGGTLYVADADHLPMATALQVLRVVRGHRHKLPAAAPRLVLGHTVRANVPPRSSSRPTLADLLGCELLVVLPVRDRPGRLEAYVEHFVSTAAAARKLAPPAPATLAAVFAGRPLPGNLRELKLAIDRRIASGNGDAAAPRGAVADVVVRRGAVPTPASSSERDRIIAALTACAFNQSRAAAQLGMSRRTLGTRLDQLGITRPFKPRGRAS